MNDALVTQLLAQADAHLRARRFPEASQLYLRVLAVQPHQARALGGLGQIAFGAGQFQVAEPDLAAAWATDPSAVSVGNSLGCLYRSTNRLDQARALLRDVTARAP